MVPWLPGWLACLLKPHRHLHVSVSRHVQILLEQLRHHLHDGLKHAAERIRFERQTRYVLARRNEHVGFPAVENIDAVQVGHRIPLHGGRVATLQARTA